MYIRYGSATPKQVQIKRVTIQSACQPHELTLVSWSNSGFHWRMIKLCFIHDQPALIIPVCTARTQAHDETLNR